MIRTQAQLSELCLRLEPPDQAFAREAQRRLDQKTKPLGSLGRLERLVCQIAAVQRRMPLPPQKAIVIMGADHGVTEEGVSAYPAEVTNQMLLNFARGGAAINVLARQVGAKLLVVDMGTRAPLASTPEILSRRLGSGTCNMTKGPAMTLEQGLAGVQTGLSLAADLAAQGITLVGVGEMGIGNSTAASALTAGLLKLPVESVVGRGTGIDDEGLARKRRAVTSALEVNHVVTERPFGALCAVGGFELAGLVGVILGAACHRIPVVLDGFIASTAALVAAKLAPNISGYLIAGHQSVEPGHAHLLPALGLEPLLRLDMRLGEGTGAALAFGIIESALRVLAEMATFEQAGVSSVHGG